MAAPVLLQGFLEQFIVEKEQQVPPPPPEVAIHSSPQPAANVQESNTIVDSNGESDGPIKANGKAKTNDAAVVQDGRCTRNGCRKKSNIECSNRMCTICCSTCPTAGCVVHNEARIKRQEEDHYIEEGIRSLMGGNQGKKTKFYHFEEKFMNHSQTVVIWCFKDFCRNKRWSGDTFAQLRLERRRRSRSLFDGKWPSSSPGPPVKRITTSSIQQRDNSSSALSTTKYSESSSSSSSSSSVFTAAEDSQGNNNLMTTKQDGSKKITEKRKRDNNEKESIVSTDIGVLMPNNTSMTALESPVSNTANL